MRLLFIIKNNQIYIQTHASRGLFKIALRAFAFTVDDGLDLSNALCAVFLEGSIALNAAFMATL